MLDPSPQNVSPNAPLGDSQYDFATTDLPPTMVVKFQRTAKTAGHLRNALINLCRYELVAVAAFKDEKLEYANDLLKCFTRETFKDYIEDMRENSWAGVGPAPPVQPTVPGDPHDAAEVAAALRDTIRRQDEANRIHNLVPFPDESNQRLLALREWCEYRTARGESPDVTQFNWVDLDRWMERTSQYDELYAGQQHLHIRGLPELKSVMDDWPVFYDALSSLLGQLRSNQLFCPLSYLVRQSDEPTKADLSRTDYASLDDEMIATICHHGETFKDNNSILWTILWSKTWKGDAWSVIARYQEKQDGRKAFLALKRAAESGAHGDGGKASGHLKRASGSDDVITPADTKKAKTADETKP